MRVIDVITSDDYEEIRYILTRAGYIPHHQHQVEIPLIVERWGNYAKVSFCRAYSLYRQTKTPVLAEETGLEIYGMARFPGRKSMLKWAMELGLDEKDEVQILLKIISRRFGDSWQKIRARVISCIVLFDEEGHAYVSKGELEGWVVSDIRGQYGRWYKKVFVPLFKEEDINNLETNTVVKDALKQQRLTLAELPYHLQAMISHRKRALQGILKGESRLINLDMIKKLRG